MTNKYKCESQEILSYSYDDFKDFCKECQEKLFQKYRYNNRDDKFWLEQIEQLRFNHFKLIEFVKEIAQLENLPKGITCQHILNRSKDLLREIGEL